jgi:hypothetical protein
MDYEEDEDDVAVGEALTGPLSDAFSGLQGENHTILLDGLSVRGLQCFVGHSSARGITSSWLSHVQNSISYNIERAILHATHSASSTLQAMNRNISDKRSNAHSPGLMRIADPSYSQA